MSIFICWSGDRSHGLAKAVEDLVARTLTKDVFVSDSIEKGVAWFDSVVKELQASKAGIVCITAENLESPWMHFEAGALALGLKNRQLLFTLLHGVTGAELKGPLGAYQATSTTRAEMGAMIASIASVLDTNDVSANGEIGSITDENWNSFNAAVDEIAVPARKLVPALESLFRRKTFDEPLHHCADQAWLKRYDGARGTLEQLASHLGRVRAACSEHECGLFEMLLTELDGYAMSIQALLLTPKTFELGDSGELTMDSGIRTCCEDRRLAIRSLAGRLLDPLDKPSLPEAVHFMAAETNEERKMIIHRLEGKIRRQSEFAFEHKGEKDLWDHVFEDLTGDQRPMVYRESSWDLDRIYYYLLVQYFGIATLRWEPPAHRATLVNEARPMPQDWLCGARDVEMEVERYRAKSKGGSLMPMTYTLVALQQITGHEAPIPDEAQTAVQSALELVGTALEPSSDACRVIDRIRAGIPGANAREVEPEQ